VQDYLGIFHSNQDLQAGLVCSVRSIIAVLSETIGQSLIVKNEPVEDQSVNQLAVAVYNDHYRPRVEKLQDNPDNQTSLIAQLNQLGEIYSGLRDIAQNPGNAPATRLITLVNDYIIKYLKRNMDRFDVASVYAFRLGLMAQTIVATAKELDVEVDVSKAVKRGIDNLVKDAE
jgi:hypothetical protein